MASSITFVPCVPMTGTHPLKLFGIIFWWTGLNNLIHEPAYCCYWPQKCMWRLSWQIVLLSWSWSCKDHKSFTNRHQRHKSPILGELLILSFYLKELHLKIERDGCGRCCLIRCNTTELPSPPTSGCGFLTACCCPSLTMSGQKWQTPRPSPMRRRGKKWMPGCMRLAHNACSTWWTWWCSTTTLCSPCSQGSWACSPISLGKAHFFDKAVFEE